ncbi:MAG: Mur ligase family protein, partial [Acidobacteriota bacterium]
NADDPNIMWMATLTRAGIITYGIHEKSDVHAKNIQINPPSGMECDVEINKESYRLKIPWLGRHLIYQALAALAVAVAEGIDIPESCRNLEKLKTVEGRMQGVVLPSGAVLIRDDCKATRESIWSALETLGEYPAERKFLVLGGVSEILNNERYAFFRDLGSRISKAADYGCLYMDNNSFRCCRVGAAAGGMDRDRLTRIKLDPLSILHLLPDDLGKGDVILIKGRPDYKISRLSLALMGKEVNCRIMSCPVTTSFCDDCSMLKQSWQRKSRAKKIGS